MEKEPHTVEILIAEDSATQRLLLQKNLDDLGYQVRCAKSGQEALEEIQKKLPDLLITDIKMPQMDGFELCSAVRQNSASASLPVILLTALSDPKEVVNGINCKADYFLTKPCNIDLMGRIIKDCLSEEPNVRSEQEIGLVWHGERLMLHADTNKLSSLLLSTYCNVMEKNDELRMTQNEIKRKNIQLEALNKQKSDFLSLAAHDLRSPLTSIMLCCDVIQEQVQDPKVVNTVRHAAKNMLNLINQLLEVSISESGEVNLELSECQLSELFEACVEGLRPVAQQKEIDLNLEVLGSIPAISCDSGKVEQVLANFITNAIKYSHPKTAISVKLTAEENQISFEVQDQGQGIPEAEIGKLFLPFSRTSTQTTAGEQSIGLGLSICKSIIEKHGGHVGCKSEVGKGSTFYASFPAKTGVASN